METLRLGSKGQAVRNLQRKLTELGFYTMAIDGDFGPGTQTAVIEYQKARNLMPDGVVGDKFRNVMNGKSGAPAWQLTLTDLEEAARALGCELAAIRAVSAVESAGSGMHSNGVPKILYERHIMRRQLLGVGLNLLVEIASKARPDLVNTQTGGYRYGKLEYQRLEKAAELNPLCAHESISMGRYQIMGFHARSIGYRDAIDMFAKLSKGEKEQLQAFVSFIKNDKDLHNALVKKDWKTFARIYNGPSYAKNKYDVKLKEHYEMFA